MKHKKLNLLCFWNVKSKGVCKAAQIKAVIGTGCVPYPFAFFLRGCSWIRAWTWPLVAIRFAGFGGGGGSRRGCRQRGAFLMGRGGMRQSTVGCGWRRRRFLFLFDRCRSVICEKGLKRHGGGLKVIFLLLRWSVFWHLLSPYEKSQHVEMKKRLKRLKGVVWYFYLPLGVLLGIFK